MPAVNEEGGQEGAELAVMGHLGLGREGVKPDGREPVEPFTGPLEHPIPHCSPGALPALPDPRLSLFRPILMRFTRRWMGTPGSRYTAIGKLLATLLWKPPVCRAGAWHWRQTPGQA